MSRARRAEIIGELALQVDFSRGEAPLAGDCVVITLGGDQGCLFEVVRIARYLPPLRVGEGWATHFVRLHRRRVYLED